MHKYNDNWDGITRKTLTNLFEATTAKKTASSATVQGDDGQTYKVKEIQAAVDAAKVVKANGITRGSSKKNFAHFKILYGLVNDMRSKKIPYDMDSFVELALKAASREGAAGAFKLLIGDFVGVGVPFAGWVDEFVPMNVSKTNDKKLKYYFDMWYGMASGDY